MTYMEPQGGLTLNNLLSSLNVIGWSLKKNTGDIWEIVVPKNRTEIIRTQTFMESELSAIFGGKLRSVAKSRGKYMSFTSYIFV
jgi:ubiquitin carboxyl-terminal hydrolase 10